MTKYYVDFDLNSSRHSASLFSLVKINQRNHLFFFYVPTITTRFRKTINIFRILKK